MAKFNFIFYVRTSKNPWRGCLSALYSLLRRKLCGPKIWKTIKPPSGSKLGWVKNGRVWAEALRKMADCLTGWVVEWLGTGSFSFPVQHSNAATKWVLCISIHNELFNVRFAFFIRQRRARQKLHLGKGQNPRKKGTRHLLQFSHKTKRNEQRQPK